MKPLPRITSKHAVAERLRVWILFQSGHNSAEIGRIIGLAECDVERIMHMRVCRDVAREVRSLRDQLKTWGKQ